MLTYRKKTARGSALVLVMITVAVGLAIIAIVFNQSDRLQKLTGFYKRQNRLKYSALSGVEVALADLNERSRKKDFSTALGSGHNEAEHEAVGLIVTQDWTQSWMQQNLKPRFTSEDRDGIILKVYYFPDRENWVEGENYNNVFPKFYHIVSQSTNPKTGDNYTAESMVYMYTQGATSLAFGIMDPKLPSSLTRFTFSPSYFDGHVHFGIDQTSQLYFNYEAEPDSDAGGNILPTMRVIPYVFEGPVTMLTNKPETGYPFDKSDHTAMIFEKGYVAKSTGSGNNDNQSLDTLQDSIDFNEIYEEAMGSKVGDPAEVDVCADKPSGSKRACIWMKEDGKAYEYTCGTNPAEIDPTVRYGAAISGKVWTGNKIFKCRGGDPVLDEDGRITSLPDPGSIEVKGVYKASYTFVADDIVVGGDMVNFDQRVQESPYILGLVARRNLVIPTGVPASGTELWYHANDFYKISGGASPSGAQCDDNPYMVGCPGVAEGSELASKVTLISQDNYFTGKTNFIVPSTSPEVSPGRRDRDDTDDYSTQPTCHTTGCPSSRSYEAYVEGRAGNYWKNGPMIRHSLMVGGVQKGWQREGEYNSPFVLDLDAAILVGGAVKMDGFWNFGDNADATSQLQITGISGTTYDASIAGDTANPNAFYNSPIWFNGPTVPKEEPAYCCRGAWCQQLGYGVPVNQPCPITTALQPDKPRHMLRPAAHSIVVHGSLVSRDYSQLRYNYNHITNQGFQYSYFYHDPRLSSQVPMGFPQNTSLVVQRLWTKESKGTSPLLTGITH